MSQADEMFDFFLQLANLAPAICQSQGHVRFGVDGPGEGHDFFPLMIARCSAHQLPVTASFVQNKCGNDLVRG